MSRWQYRVLILNTLHQPNTLEWADADDFGGGWIEKQLNEMGQDGWQLVTLVPARPADFTWKHPLSEAEFAKEANPWIYHVIFKKPMA